MLQQAVSVISNWLNKGEPMFNAVVWGLWRTYAAVVECEPDLEKLKLAMCTACEKTAGLPLHRFFMVQTSTDALTTFESESRELQLIFASFVQIAMKLTLKEIFNLGRGNSMKEAMQQFMSFASKLHPEMSDAHDQLLRQINNGLCNWEKFQTQCTDLECVQLVQWCQRMTEDEGKKIGYISQHHGQIIEMCKRFLSNSTFTDWQQRRSFLNDVSAVLKDMLALLSFKGVRRCREFEVVKKLAVKLYRVRHLDHYFHALQQESFEQKMTELAEFQKCCTDKAFKFNLEKRLSQPVSLADPKLSSSIVRLCKNGGALKPQRNQIAVTYLMTALDWKTNLMLDERLVLFHQENFSGNQVLDLMMSFNELKTVRDVNEMIQELLRYLNESDSGRGFGLVRKGQAAVGAFFSGVRNALQGMGPSTSYGPRPRQETDPCEMAFEAQKKLDTIINSPETASILSQQLDHAADFHAGILNFLVKNVDFGEARRKSIDATVRSKLRDRFRNLPESIFFSEFRLIWVCLFNPNAKIGLPLRLIKCNDDNIHLDLLGESDMTAVLLLGDLNDGSCLDDLVSLVIFERDSAAATADDNLLYISHFTMRQKETFQDQWLQKWKKSQTKYSCFVQKCLLSQDVQCDVSLSRLGQNIISCLFTLYSHVNLDQRGGRQGQRRADFSAELKNQSEQYKRSLSFFRNVGEKETSHLLLSVDEKLLELRRSGVSDPIKRRLETISLSLGQAKRLSIEKDIRRVLTEIKKRIISEEWESASIAYSFNSLMARLHDCPVQDITVSLSELQREAKSRFDDVFAALDLICPILKLREVLCHFALERIDIQSTRIWMKCNDICAFVSNLVAFFVGFLVRDGDDLQLDRTRNAEAFDEWQRAFQTLSRELDIPTALLTENSLVDFFKKLKDQYCALLGEDDRQLPPAEKEIHHEVSTRPKARKQMMASKFEQLKNQYQKLWQDAKEKAQPSVGIMTEAMKAVQALNVLKPDDLNDIVFARYQNRLDNLRFDLDKPLLEEDEQSSTEYLSEVLPLLNDCSRCLNASDFTVADSVGQMQPAPSNEVHSLEAWLKQLHAFIHTSNHSDEELKHLMQLARVNSSASVWNQALHAVRRCQTCEDITEKQAIMADLSTLPIFSGHLCRKLAFQSSSPDLLDDLVRTLLEELMKTKADLLMTSCYSATEDYSSGTVKKAMKYITDLCSGDNCSMGSVHPILESLKKHSKELWMFLDELSAQIDSPLSFACPQLTMEDVIVLFNGCSPIAHGLLIGRHPTELAAEIEAGSLDLSETNLEGFVTSHAYHCPDGEVLAVLKTPDTVDSVLLALAGFDLEAFLQTDEVSDSAAKALKETLVCFCVVLMPVLLMQENSFDRVAAHVRLSSTVSEQKAVEDLLTKIRNDKAELVNTHRALEIRRCKHFAESVPFCTPEEASLKRMAATLEQRIQEAETRLSHAEKALVRCQKEICDDLSKAAKGLMTKGLCCFSQLLGLDETYLEECLCHEEFLNDTVLSALFEEIVLCANSMAEQASKEDSIQTKALEEWNTQLSQFRNQELAHLVDGDPLKKTIHTMCTASSLGNKRMAQLLSNGRSVDPADQQELSDLAERMQTGYQLLRERCINCCDHEAIESAAENLLSVEKEITHLQQQFPEQSHLYLVITHAKHLLLHSVGVLCAHVNAIYPLTWYREALVPRLEKSVEDWTLTSMPPTDEGKLKMALNRLPCWWKSTLDSMTMTNREGCLTNPYQLAWAIERHTRQAGAQHQATSFASRIFSEGILGLYNTLCSSTSGTVIMSVAEVGYFTRIANDVHRLLSMDVATKDMNEVQALFTSLENNLQSLTETMMQSRKCPRPFLTDHLGELSKLWFFKTADCCMQNLQRDSAKSIILKTLPDRMRDAKHELEDISSILVLADFQDISRLYEDLSVMKIDPSQMCLSQNDIEMLTMSASITGQLNGAVRNELVEKWRAYKAYAASWTCVSRYESFIDVHHMLAQAPISTILQQGTSCDKIANDVVEDASCFMGRLCGGTHHEIKTWETQLISEFDRAAQAMKAIHDGCKSSLEDYETGVKSFLEIRRQKREDAKRSLFQRLMSVFESRRNLCPVLCRLAEELCCLYAQCWKHGDQIHQTQNNPHWYVEQWSGMPFLSRRLKDVVQKQEQLYNKKLVEHEVVPANFGLKWEAVMVEMLTPSAEHSFWYAHDGCITISCQDGIGAQAVVNRNTLSSIHQIHFGVLNEKSFKLKISIQTKNKKPFEKVYELDDLNRQREITLRNVAGCSSITFHPRTLRMYSGPQTAPDSDWNLEGNIYGFISLSDEMRKKADEYILHFEDFQKKQREEDELGTRQKDAEAAEKSQDSELRRLQSSPSSKAVTKAKSALDDLVACMAKCHSALSAIQNENQVLQQQSSAELSVMLSQALKILSEVNFDTNRMHLVDLTHSGNEDLSTFWNVQMRDAFFQMQSCILKLNELGTHPLRNLTWLSIFSLCQRSLYAVSSKDLSALEQSQQDWVTSLNELFLPSDEKEIITFRANIPLQSALSLGRARLQWAKCFKDADKTLMKTDQLKQSDLPLLAGTRLSHLTKLVIVQSESGSYCLSNKDNSINFGTLLHEDDAKNSVRGTQIYTLEVMNSTSSSMIVGICPESEEANFSVIGPSKIRLYGKTSQQFRFAVKREAVGTINESWKIETEDLKLDAVFELLANVQRLAIQLDTDKIDFGVHLPGSDVQTRTVNIRNVTDLPLLIKGRVQHMMRQSTLTMSKDRFILGPRETDFISISLKPGALEEDINHCLVIGAVQNFKQLRLNAKIKRPEYILVTEAGKMINSTCSLPATMPSKEASMHFKIKNIGLVPVKFKLSSPGLRLSVSASSGMVPVEKESSLIKLFMKGSYSGRQSSTFEISVDGCEAKSISVRGNWVDPRPVFDKPTVAFKVEARELAMLQRDGDNILIAHATNKLVNKDDMRVVVYPPKSQCFRFDREEYVLEPKERLEFEMQWNVTRLNEKRHRVPFITDGGHEIHFHVQLDVPNLRNTTVEPHSLTFLNSVKHGNEVSRMMKIGVKDKFSIKTTEPRADQIESLTLKSLKGSAGSRGPWPFGSEEIPEFFERIAYFRPEFEVCLKTGQSPGWIVEDVVVENLDSVFVQEDVSKCIPLHHRITLVAHVSEEQNAFARMMQEVKQLDRTKLPASGPFCVPDTRILEVFKNVSSPQSLLLLMLCEIAVHQSEWLPTEEMANDILKRDPEDAVALFVEQTKQLSGQSSSTSNSERMTEYAKMLVDHFDANKEAFMNEICVPALSLKNSSQSTRIVARAQYMLLHANCSEHEQWRAAVACLKLTMPDTLSATLFDMACESIWNFACLGGREEVSLRDSIEDLRNTLLYNGFEDVAGLKLVESIIKNVSEDGDESNLTREIKGFLTEDAASGISQRLADLVLVHGEVDSMTLMAEIVEPELKQLVEKLVSDDARTLLDGFCSLAQLNHLSVNDKLIKHLLNFLPAKTSNQTSADRARGPEIKAKRAIAPVLGEIGMGCICEPLCSLRKDTYDSYKNQCIRKIVIESLFCLLLKVNDGQDKRLDEIRCDALKISGSSYPSYEINEALFKIPNREKRSGLRTKINAWINADPLETDIPGLVHPLSEVVNDLMASGMSVEDQMRQRSKINEVTHLLTRALSDLDPATIKRDTHLGDLMSRVFGFAAALKDEFKQYMQIGDALAELAADFSPSNVMALCKAIATASHSDNLADILHILDDQEDERSIKADVLMAILPEEERGSLLELIDSWFDDINLDDVTKEKAERICDKTALNNLSMLVHLANSKTAIKLLDEEEMNSLSGLLKIKDLVDAIASLAEWSKHKKKSLAVLDVFFGCNAYLLTKDVSLEASALSKMTLILALAKFYSSELWKRTEAMLGEAATLKFERAVMPEVPESSEIVEETQDIVPEQSDKNTSSDAESDAVSVAEHSVWHWFLEDVEIKEEQLLPVQADTTESEIGEAVADIEDENANGVPIVHEAHNDKFEHVKSEIEHILNTLNLSECVSRAQTHRHLTTIGFNDVVDTVVKLKMASDSWNVVFEEAVERHNSLRVEQWKAFDSQIVCSGISILSLIDFIDDYLKACSLFRIPEEMHQVRDSIIQNLNAIPKGNLPEEFQLLLEESGATAVIKGTTTDDFPMPSAKVDLDRLGTKEGGSFEPHPVGPSSSQGIRTMELNPEMHVYKVSMRDQMQKMLAAVAEHEDEQKARGRHGSIQKQKITIHTEEAKQFKELVGKNGENKSTSDDEDEIIDKRNLELPSSLIATSSQMLGRFSHSKKKTGQADDLSHGCDVLAAAPEDDSMKTIQADFTVDVSVTRKQLREQDLAKIYKDTAITRPDVELHAVPDPVEAKPVLHDKWTYDLLVGSKPFVMFLVEVMHRFEAYFEKFYHSVAERHRIEWCILVDNSGSMLTKETQTTEALVLAMETLRRLECPFTVARFGDRNAQQILKSMDQAFTPLIGQKILESFSYDQGTYPASAIANVAEKIWKHKLSDQEAQQCHRVMLMIVDGLTQERAPEDYIIVCKDKNMDLIVLNLEDDAQHEVMSQIRVLWDKVATCYEVLNVNNIDLLPRLLVGLMIQQMDSILGRIKNRKDLASTHEAVRVVPVKLNANLGANAFEKMCSGFGKQKLPKLPTEYKSDSFYSCDVSLDVVPYSAERTELVKDEIGMAEMCPDGVFENIQQQLSSVQQSIPDKRAVLKKAEAAWNTAEDRLGGLIGRMAEALAVYLPDNVYTRKRADIRGSSIHLQGFIKHLATQGNEQKIFANKKGGGKPEYAIVILLDISESMTHGRKQVSALETVFLLVAALKQMNIQNFSVVLFGQGIYPVKLPDMPWEDVSIALLISHVLHIHEQATMDADALLFAAELLEASGLHGPKKIFVVTDGYGSSGVRLAGALERLQESGIDVLAMGVGPEAFFIEHCYNKWVTAALPQFIPDAIERLEDLEQSKARKQTGNQKDTIDWLSVALLPEEAADSIEEVLANKRAAFPNLLEAMRTEREVKLKQGNRPSAFTVDICFAMDCTGSMSPWIGAAKEQIRGISQCISQKIKEAHPDIELEFRYGMVAYRDYGDANQLSICPMSAGVEQLHQFLQSQTARGGSDTPEDVLGALNAVADMDGWESRVRFCLLIGDAPGHGRDLNDCANDRYKGGDPNGLTSAVVMEKLKAKDIHLMFCRITDRTDKMIAQFARDYNDKCKFELNSKDIFGTGQVTSHCGYHFIFCLDESGSMSGQPWNDLQNAFHTFIAKRVSDQSENDLVTVIQFSSGPRFVHQRQPLHSGLALAPPVHQGTQFVPPLDYALNVLAGVPRGEIPVLIFMSDGCAGDCSSTILARIQAIRPYLPNQSMHTIGFSSGAGHALLQDMANQGGGRHHRAIGGVELSQTFHHIAASSNAADVVVSQFGKVISDMVASAVILGHL